MTIACVHSPRKSYESDTLGYGESFDIRSGTKNKIGDQPVGSRPEDNRNLDGFSLGLPGEAFQHSGTSSA